MPLLGFCSALDGRGFDFEACVRSESGFELTHVVHCNMFSIRLPQWSNITVTTRPKSFADFNETFNKKVDLENSFKLVWHFLNLKTANTMKCSGECSNKIIYMWRRSPPNCYQNIAYWAVKHENLRVLLILIILGYQCGSKELWYCPFTSRY